MPLPQKQLQTISTTDVWDLHARPDLVFTAAHGWRDVASALTSAADGASHPLTWQGPAADSFFAHRHQLLGDLDGASALAEAVAAVLDRMASALRESQAHLTEEWGRVVDIPFSYDAPGHLVFSPATTADQRVVHVSVDACVHLRHDLGHRLACDAAEFEKARRAFVAMASAWLPVADGTAQPFSVPPDVAGTSLLYVDNEVVVSTGAGSDTVEVGVDQRSGLQYIAVNGRRHSRLPRRRHRRPYRRGQRCDLRGPGYPRPRHVDRRRRR